MAARPAPPRPRAGIVWTDPHPVASCSFRFERYAAGLEALGYEPLLLCTEEASGGLDVPCRTVEDALRMEQEELWRELELDTALAVTWHRMSPMLRAIGAAGTRVISIADSDGEVGYGAHPLAMWRRLRVYASGPADLLHRARYFFRQWRRSRLGTSGEDREYLASTRLSEVVVLGNGRAREQFARFLEMQGAPELVRRLRVAPFTVAGDFLAAPVERPRGDRIVAVGRWRDPQKDAALLAATLSVYLRRHPGAEVHLVGESEPTLEALAAARPSVLVRGLLQPAALAELLAESRILLSSSRWEGSPHAAFEALATGVTLVGPRMPYLASFCTDEGYGQVSRRRSPASLAEALEEENRRWESGEREPRKIAGVWRARVDPVAVCREMLGAADRERSASPATARPRE